MVRALDFIGRKSRNPKKLEHPIGICELILTWPQNNLTFMIVDG